MGATLAVFLIAAIPASAADEDVPNARFAFASANGSHIYFGTTEALLPADRDEANDIYLRVGSRLRLMTGGPYDAVDAFPARADAISPDGRRLIFATSQRLAPADNDDGGDLYVTNGVATRLLSGGAILGGTGEEVSFLGASRDTTRVLMSTEEQLAPEDNDRNPDIYLGTGGSPPLLLTPGLVTRPYFEGATPDAKHVYFDAAAQLAPADVDRNYDIYERFEGMTRLISTGPQANRAMAPGGVSLVRASPSGATAVFRTDERLVGSDHDRFTDIYARTPTGTQLIEPKALGRAHSLTISQQRDGAAAVSENAKRILVETAGRLVGSDRDKGLGDLYLFGPNGVSFTSTAPDSKSLSYETDFAGASPGLDHIWFSTSEPLMPADRDRSPDIYERTGGRIQEVTRALDTDGNAGWAPHYAGSSDDGTVTFIKTTAALVPRDENGGSDLYRLAGGKPLLLTRPRRLEPLIDVADNDEPEDKLIAENTTPSGSVIFLTTAKALVPADRDEARDVYAASATELMLVSGP